MGRSHTWNRPVDMDKALFVKAKEDFLKILPEIRKQAPKLTGIEGLPKPIVEDFGIFFHMDPAEQFVLACMTPEPKRSRVKPGKTTLYGYVKTYHIPEYDLAVMSCLLVFKHHFGDTFRIGSDAGVEDWQSAIDFVSKHLGYKKVWHFIDVEVDGEKDKSLEPKEAA